MTTTSLIGPNTERTLTMMDYLRAEEMDETPNQSTTIVDQKDSDDLPTLQCMTPRQIVSRWLKKLRHSKKNKQPSSSTPKTLTTFNHVEGLETPLQDSESGIRSGAANNRVSGGPVEEMENFKLGAGLGLALVVAASKNELDKMMELRKQMEMIVEGAKEELRCKSAVCRLGQVGENAMSYTVTNVDESINSNERVSYPNCIGSRSSPYVEKESAYFEIDDKEWCQGVRVQERSIFNGMSQLESELEAELQLLELQLDSVDTSRDNQDVVEESSDAGCETLGYDEEVDYANDLIDNFTEAHYGSVPPQELERRLHELLEAQQLERIKELEAALKHTKQKLRKREVEVCWWKDTAHFISQHVSKSSAHTVPPQKNLTYENIR